MARAWLILAGVLLMVGMTGALANPVRSERSAAWLLSEDTALKPGSTQWLAFRLEMAPGWHTYWRNPGDSGAPLMLDWTLPAGLSVGALEWPYPKKVPVGPLTDIGYHGSPTFLVPLEVDPALADGELSVSLLARWLICKAICVPEEARLSLVLPVRSGPSSANPLWQDVFREARTRLPVPSPYPVTLARTGNRLSLLLADPALAEGRITRAEFFPDEGGVVRMSQPQRLHLGGEGLRLDLIAVDREAPAPGRSLTGVLVIEEDAGGAPLTRALTVAAAPSAGPPGIGIGFWPALGFALLGGLLLNLMPCVLPVLALKAIDIAGRSGQSLAAGRAAALAYGGGVIASMLCLAGLLLALRAGGVLIGWGFQLQEPIVVALLAYVMLVVGLALSGVVTLGTSLQRLGGRLAQGGAPGSFATGVLAVVLASPCTVPFMAAALGFALVAPVPTALAIFAALGIGLALPALAMAALPRSAALLPRPGPWLASFKALMAFPLYATAGWLVSIVGAEAGSPGVLQTLMGGVLIAFALWLIGRRPAAERSGVRRGGAALGLVAALALAATLPGTPGERAALAPALAGAEPWSPARIRALQAEGRPVFLTFTADWCVTCKVNETVVLPRAAVREAFAAQGVALLVADWTRRDPAITEALAAYGRAGVPLYLLYPPGPGSAPEVLPAILTERAILEAVARLGAGSPEREGKPS